MKRNTLDVVTNKNQVKNAKVKIELGLKTSNGNDSEECLAEVIYGNEWA